MLRGAHWENETEEYMSLGYVHSAIPQQLFSAINLWGCMSKTELVLCKGQQMPVISENCLLSLCWHLP